MKTKLSSRWVSAMGLFFSGTCLHAAVIFDSVDANGNDFIDVTYSLAQSFKTDSVNVSLTSVVLRMDAASEPSGGFFVKIYDATGASQKPNRLLATLSGPANPATAGNYAYTPTGPLDLSPNTFYWVVAGVSSGLGQYPWRRKSPPSIAVGSAIGSCYNFLLFGFGWNAPNVAEAFCMQVNAQPVAAPGPGPSLALAPDGSGGWFIRGAGQAGLSYRLQRAASLSAPWASIATNTAPPSGLLEFHDLTPLPGRGFYRTVQP